MPSSLSSTDRNTAPHRDWGDGCDAWTLLHSPALDVIEERAPPGAGEVRHRHARAAQFFYVLAGTAVVEHDGGTVELTAGQGLHVPAGRAHRFVNRGDRDVRFLVIAAPSTAGDRTDLD